MVVSGPFLLGETPQPTVPMMYHRIYGAKLLNTAYIPYALRTIPYITPYLCNPANIIAKVMGGKDSVVGEMSKFNHFPWRKLHEGVPNRSKLTICFLCVHGPVPWHTGSLPVCFGGKVFWMRCGKSFCVCPMPEKEAAFQARPGSLLAGSLLYTASNDLSSIKLFQKRASQLVCPVCTLWH